MHIAYLNIPGGTGTRVNTAHWVYGRADEVRLSAGRPYDM